MIVDGISFYIPSNKEDAGFQLIVDLSLRIKMFFL